MKNATKELFLRPLMLQENQVVFVLAPIVIFFFRYISASISKHFMIVAACALVAATWGLILGVLTKYYLVRPAIDIMDKKDSTPREMQHAVRSLAILPVTEAVVTFLRFGLFGNIIGPVFLYYSGYINYVEFLFALNAIVMIGLLAVPCVYLTSENSLSTFYMKSNLKGVLDSDMHLFRMSIGKKTLGTMLLIALPPLDLVLSLIFLSLANKVEIGSLKMGFYVLIIETFALIIVSGFLLMKNLSFSVEKMSVMFKDMAKGQGDLTKRLHVTGLNEVGELAFWFNGFMDDLEGIVGHVRETSLELHRSIEQVGLGSRNLSQATQEQAATVEEVASSIEEMNATVNNNAGLVGEGREISNKLTILINQSRQVFQVLMKAIQEVTLDSRKIGDIVSTVNEVAFHTNLLALNASVEAARAGEHGKGFAVVAGEVRSLAQRSAGASSEIKALIEGTVGRIKNSDEMVNKTSVSLEDMMSNMEIFFRMMETIGSSSIEQTKSISELHRAMTQIDDSTQQNAATVEQLASTIDNLSTMADLLAEDVQKFKISV